MNMAEGMGKQMYNDIDRDMEMDTGMGMGMAMFMLTCMCITRSKGMGITMAGSNPLASRTCDPEQLSFRQRAQASAA